MRRKLVGEEAKWTVLGQSFGGFCLLTYLSTYPEAVKAGLFTGGLPPVGRAPDEVKCYAKNKSTHTTLMFLSMRLAFSVFRQRKKCPFLVLPPCPSRCGDVDYAWYFLPSLPRGQRLRREVLASMSDSWQASTPRSDARNAIPPHTARCSKTWWYAFVDDC